MRLEVILAGEAIEETLQRIDRNFSIEKDDWYHKLLFPLRDTEEINHILKILDSVLVQGVQVLNTSIVLEQVPLKLPCDYRVSFVGPGDTPSPNKKEVILKKGLSFGGYHPTTVMCMELLMELIPERNSLKKALDLGTGNGILAIMAKRLEIEDICAVDMDLQSCIEARHNAIINGYNRDEIKIVCGNEDCIKDGFDLIMANIIFHTLEGLIERLTYMLRTGGYLIISGFLSPDTERFARLAGKNGLLTTREKEGWGALLWQKK